MVVTFYVTPNIFNEIPLLRNDNQSTVKRYTFKQYC